MIPFRTILPPLQSGLRFSHNDSILCTGSCFAEHIGGRLGRWKFPVLANPFGIVYNPVSLAESLDFLLSDQDFSEKDLFENAGLWHSFAHHGSFSHPEKTAALDRISCSLSGAKAFLSTTNRLIVTLGTANVFVLKKTGRVVANCHKVPGQEFERRRLSVGEIADGLFAVFEKLKAALPGLEILATVSPVRHLRDGLVENQRSKATLVLALEQICQRCRFVHYFPAYELLLDDLRDYRFYENDLSHPNQLAVDYIWQFFADSFFDEKTKALCQRIAQTVVASGHRPFHPQSAEHQAFLKTQLEKIKVMEQEFPWLDFDIEKAAFQQQLTA
jgi:hypothetical protein